MNDAREIMELDLTLQEQENVRNAIMLVRVQFGGWKPLAMVLKFDHTTLIHVCRSRRAVTASMAFRLARLIGVGIDDLLGGKWPEAGTCPRCGYKDVRNTKPKGAGRFTPPV